MTARLGSTLVISLIILPLTSLWAQPSNDECADAIEVPYSENESSANLISGDTRGATASSSPLSVCSQSWYNDDIWFKFICPTDLPANGIRIKSYFNPDIDSTDLPAVGMALYENCDSTELPLICFSSNKPEDNFIDITSLCLMPDHSYFVRIWSTGITSSTEGTFKVGIFPVPDDAKKPVWWETFNGGLEKNGWTTEGTCAIADSNQNSGWVYIPTGLIDKGAYIFHGASLVSESICDGAVGVDSDFLDNFGDPNNAGSGPCPAPSQHILISPEINTSTWGGRSVYIQWDQAIRNYESTYYYSIRTRDEGGSWSDWKDYQINIEFVTNGNFISHNIQQHPLPGSQGHKFIQIRFIYNANYYLWAIDDVKLIPAVANNDLAITFGGVTPWVSLPADQTFPYCTKIDLYNEGFTPQTHAKVANTIINTGTSDTIYQWHTSIDTIWPGQEISSLQQNELIEIPPIQGTYFSAYSATQDQPDNLPYNNSISNYFYLGGDIFANEDGFTRSVAVNTGIFGEWSLSWGYGNIFRIQNDILAQQIIWGANNPQDMVGKSVNINLIEWTDLNGDEIAEPFERKLIGTTTYTFDGSEGENVLIESTLENIETHGDPIVMKKGKMYMAMVEYIATSPGDPKFFMLASEKRNFKETVAACDSAYDKGLIDYRLYMSVLEYSPQGINSNMDFQVRDLDPNDSLLHFGDNIVPVVRIATKTVNTFNDVHPKTNIAVYPNPATNELHIKYDFSQVPENTQIFLIDIFGHIVNQTRLVQSTYNDIVDFSIAPFMAGIYELRISSSAGQFSTPVMIVK